MATPSRVAAPVHRRGCLILGGIVGPVLPRLACVVFAFAVLAATSVAEAGVSPLWRQLGSSSASGNGVSQTPSPKAVFDGALAVGGDGRPVVAYTEYPDAIAAQGVITVKRWTGALWETLSGPSGVGQGYEPQVRVSASGAIYVAWLKDDANGNTEIRLRVRTTSTFAPLGGSDSPGGISGANAGITVPFSLALNASGNPIVAFLGLAQNGVVNVTETPALIDGTAQVYVRRWTGSAWEFVGSDFTGGGASNAVSFVTAAGDTILHDADSPSLTVDDAGAPVVAFTYFTTIDGVPTGNTDIYVTRWNATWTAVGPPVPSGESPAGVGGAGGVSTSDSGSFNPALAADATGRLALAWEEEPAAGGVHVWVRVWNGVDTWEELAGSATDSGFTVAGTTNMLPSVAIDPSGRPVVAWQALTAPENPTEIFVLRWNGTDAWEELGIDSASNAGISDAVLDALVPALALTPAGGTATAGVPTVAWLDVRDTGSAQVFLRQLYTGTTVPLTVTVSGDGTVTSNPIGVECVTGTCVTEFPLNTSVTLLPQGGPTGAFGSWSGACTGSAACTVVMSANRSVNVSFVPGATLTVDVLSAGGRVSSSPAGITNCVDSCSANFAVGPPVTLTASVVPGGAFTGWGGFCAFRGTNTTCAVPLATNTSVTAAFTLKTYRLNVTVATPAGTTEQGTVGEIGGPTIACAFGAGPCSTDVGQGMSVSLVATPQPGNRFLNWSGGPCNGQTTLACRTFTMTANASITALFRASTGVQVLKAGNGTGTVTGVGFSCGVDCFESVFTGTRVTLTPTSATGSSFTGWSGDVCNGQASGACVFTAAGVSQTVSATFQLKKQRLAVSTTGSGFTTSTPAGVDCGNGHAPCTVDYDYGTTVVLTPFPDVDSMLSSWTGCTSLNGSICTVVMTANRTVVGKFVTAHTLDVAASGNGSGKITSATPPGLTCVSNCSVLRLFPATASVVLTPQPAVGTNFHWTAGVCSGAGACTTLMSFNRSAVGQFTLNRHSLKVTNRPSGDVVNVNPLPGGATIDCGNGDAICDGVFDYGTPVTLQATPNAGFVFVNWTGTACAGSTNATCPIVLKANVSVTPNFRARTLVTVVKSGNGAGTVSGPGISCGADCSEAEFDGRPVTLTAVPAVGSSFTGFTGDCVSLTSPCTFPPAGNSQTVTATFELQQRRLTVTVVGNGAVSGPGVACDTGSTPCLPDFDYGTSVPLTPTPADGHRFTGWSQSCLGVGACTKLMTANHSVTATFKPVFALTVTKTGNAGTSSGTITSSPAGISCGTNCDEIYLGGTVVTLTRSAPVTGRTFRWGDDCASRGTNATCTLTLNANASVSADYSLQRLGLAVVKNGGALGTVTGLGGAINCGADCAEVVDYGTPVTLLATPSSSPAAEFVSWTGCTTAATNASCSFTMTANRTVMVTFRPLVTSLELKTLSTAPLAVSGVRQVSAVATFTDGSQQDVTTQATWTSLAPATASVSTTGLVTGRVPGNTSVTASFRLHSVDVPVTDSMPVTVDALQTIQVACTPYGGVGELTCLPSGVNFSVYCQALGAFTNAGPGSDITDQVTWSTSNAAVARSTGLVAFNGPIRQSFRMVGPATGTGTAVLKATESGKTSPATGMLGTDPWVVQGVTPTVTDLQVTPPSGNVGVGGTLQLQATATVASVVAGCTSQEPRDFSTAVTWTSSAENLADVSFFGEVTGIAPGNATITASYGIGNPPPFSDTASITVP
jgi:hypothetical protein